MPSLLADAPFGQLTLTYEAPDGSTSTDAYGNPVPGTTSGTVNVLFAPYKFDQLRPQPGADPKVIGGRGELVNPLSFPAGIGVGSELLCTFAGEACTLKITSIIPNDLPSVAFGDFFQADLIVGG